MRVLFLTGEFPPMQGGVGDCTHEIARALAALGVQVCVLTSTQVANGTRTTEYAQRPIVKNWNWSSFRVIQNTIREFAANIIHIQYQTAAYGMHPAINFFPLLLKRRAPFVKIVFTYHDLKEPYLFPKAGWFRKFVTQLPARLSDAVIATNEEDYRTLLTWNLKLTTLIPIGSNIPPTPPPNYQRAAWRAQLGVAVNEILLCYFGFLNESKGGETLIRALTEIPGVKLLMIGGQIGASDPTNVAYLTKVKALIADLGLTDRVLWTDYTLPEIVTANFLASDICVLPYRDGASYRRGTLMAALAHAMPIVTTRASSNQKADRVALPALRDEHNCLLVAPDNPHMLAEAIQRAVGSPSLRARISGGAGELARHFTWDRIAQQHWELYDQLCRAK
jgi:glycosyltransferase involved in cell wall biosynthesis